jgi:hypothetical protein
MQPWKMFIKSVTVVTVLTAGGFAAGQSVVPFMHTSRTANPQVVEGDDTAPDAEAPAVDPAVEEGTDSTTTTTKAPKAEAPEESTTTTTTTTTVSSPIDVIAPTAVEDHAPKAPKAPEAPKAPKAPKAAKPAVACKDRTPKPKGDHNGDTHCDNGWHNKDADWIAAHQARANDHSDKADDRSGPVTVGDAPAHPEQAKDDEHRPESAPGQAKSQERQASAPGRMKHSL